MIDEHFCDCPTVDVGRFPNHRDLSLMEKFIQALCGLQPSDISTLYGIETLNANVLRPIDEGVAVDKMDSRGI